MSKPLAARIRPDNVEDFVGQQHILAKDKPLRKLIEQKRLPSAVIFWGPPGVGKTTIARIIANTLDTDYMELSAVNAGKKDLEKAVNQSRLYQKPTIVFLDEIHRFNKAQQDFLLPYVEEGVIKLIGATTENPSFEVNAALLSRARVFTFKELTVQDITQLIEHALSHDKQLTEKTIDHEAKNIIAQLANGDARRACNILEQLAHIEATNITTQDVAQLEEQRMLRYDKTGEQHYDIISAMHKSMRDSDVDAAIYWVVRMLEGGEDPKYIVRRMIRFASEDIGNANPYALTLAVSTKDAVEFLGVPECNTALVQCAAYLAKSKKSNRSYVAAKKAAKTVKQTGNLSVPLVMRNSPTKLMKELGYKKGYIYAHDDPEGAKEQQHLPDELKGERFYTKSKDTSK